MAWQFLHRTSHFATSALIFWRLAPRISWPMLATFSPRTWSNSRTRKSDVPQSTQPDWSWVARYSR